MAKQHAEDAIEKIKREVSILDLAGSLGYTPVRKGNRYFSLVEADSVRIDPERNCFFRNSRIKSNGKKVAGNPIQFYMHFTGETDHSKAVIALLKMTTLPHFTPRKQKTVKKEKEPFALPEKYQGHYSRTFAYLNRIRGIHPAVIGYMVKHHYLYEEGKHHNAVFVGYDCEGKPQYFFQKGTNTKYPFAGDPTCEAKKEVGIFIDNQSDSLVFSEAMVDTLSVMTLMNMKGNDFRKHNHLAMCGNNLECLRYWLSHSKQPKTIILAVDNDQAGDSYKQGIKQILKEVHFKGKLYDRVPINKDFNEDLQQSLKIGKWAEPEESLEMER